MGDSSNCDKYYIPKEDFDWDYYINQNQDIKKAGIISRDPAYKHWITYGCYENRWVRSLKSGKVSRIKLKASEKLQQNLPNPAFIQSPPISSTLIQPTFFQSTFIQSSSYMPAIAQSLTPRPLNLGFKIAVMIHIFDVNMFPFFVSYINHLGQQYVNDNFDIYVNVVQENNPYQGDLKRTVSDYIKTIKNPNVSYFLNENRGGDIGGFLLLSKYIIDINIDYKYVIFAHSKTRSQWRKDLCQTLFNINFETLAKTPQVGIIGCKKWLHTFDPKIQQDEYRRFKYHMVDLCNIYGIDSEDSWQFIAGTMFMADISIIKYIVSHQIEEVYFKLNKPESIDINWLTIVTEELKKDPKGTGNDLQYRLKYGKPLHPDYMIEHAFERIIGLICKHLELKVIGY